MWYKLLLQVFLNYFCYNILKSCTLFECCNKKYFSWIAKLLLFLIVSRKVRTKSKKQNCLNIEKKYVTKNGFIFLQEMHSCWTRQVQQRPFFFQGKSNSCAVAIGFGAFFVATEHLWVDATINDTIFVLINIYNSNTIRTTTNCFRFNKYLRQRKRYSKEISEGNPCLKK